MGKNLILFMILTCLVWSCKDAIQEPQFKSIENVELSKVSISQLQVKADAIFHNPNPVGAKVVASDINVIANNVDLGKVSQDSIFEMQANQDFIIPMFASIPVSKILKSDSGVLGGILNAVLSKEVELEFEGSVKVELAKLTFSIPVKETKTVIIR